MSYTQGQRILVCRSDRFAVEFCCSSAQLTPATIVCYRSQVKQLQGTQYGLQRLKYLLSGTLGSLPATLPDL